MISLFLYCLVALECHPEDKIAQHNKRHQYLHQWIKSLNVTIQVKATKQHFPVVLFIMLYKVLLTFESVDGILTCDNSNESY